MFGDLPTRLSILRDGWRRYRVIVLPEVKLPPRKRSTDDEAAAVWAATILAGVWKNWRQGYVFEPMLTRKPENSPSR